MRGFIRLFLFIQLITVSPLTLAESDPNPCVEDLTTVKMSPGLFFNRLKKKAIDKILDGIAYYKGLPPYLKLNDELRETERYLKYSNFGEMGLAEMEISVSYNKSS